MAIKFNCPHCNQAFSVSDDRAGKKAQCSSCKQVFVIPFPKSQPADLEAFAAAAFGDQPAMEEPVQEQAQIEFVCSYCDAKVQVNAELAGKQTSCPECRRIVKGPLPDKAQQKDWRPLHPRRPVGARRDEQPAPEGTWSTSSMGTVSVESLVQAAALPRKVKGLTWQQRARRGAIAAGTVGSICLIAWLVFFFMAHNRE